MPLISLYNDMSMNTSGILFVLHTSGFWGQSHKTFFALNLLTSTCKLHCFILFLAVLKRFKRFSLQKWVIKFMTNLLWKYHLLKKLFTASKNYFLRQRSKKLVIVWQNFTEDQKVAHVCTKLHIFAQSCTYLHKFAHISTIVAYE